MKAMDDGCKSSRAIILYQWFCMSVLSEQCVFVRISDATDVCRDAE